MSAPFASTAWLAAKVLCPVIFSVFTTMVV